MSEIKVNSIKGVGASAAAITVNNTDGTCTANITNNLSNRNLIINGAMQVAQRGTSVTNISTEAYHTLDRFNLFTENSAGRLTMSQVADVHDGFAKALKLECTTADTSIASNETLGIQQKIEGQNLQSIQKGSSDAKQLNLSFYVKGNANATYTCELRDIDNNRINTQTFNVTSSWTKVSLTFAADTTGTFDDDNANSLQITWWLHAGSDYTSGTFATNTWATRVNANRVNSSSTSFFDSTSRTFFMTGVQLEVGSVATDFEHRSFGQELALCERYCQVIAEGANRYFATSFAYNSSLAIGCFTYKTQMRSEPSLIQTTGTNYYFLAQANTIHNFTEFEALSHVGKHASGIYPKTSQISVTQGQAGGISTVNAAAKILLSAEL